MLFHRCSVNAVAIAPKNHLRQLYGLLIFPVELIPLAATHFPQLNPIIDLCKRSKTAVEPSPKHDRASLSLIQHPTDNPLRKQQRPFDQPVLACIHRKLGVSTKYTIRPPNDDIPPEVLQEADPPTNARQVALLLHIITLQPPIDDTPDYSHKMDNQQWCQDALQCRIPDRRHGEINIVNLSQAIGASLFSVEAPHQHGRPVNLFHSDLGRDYQSSFVIHPFRTNPIICSIISRTLPPPFLGRDCPLEQVFVPECFRPTVGTEALRQSVVLLYSVDFHLIRPSLWELAGRPAHTTPRYISPVRPTRPPANHPSHIRE